MNRIPSYSRRALVRVLPSLVAGAFALALPPL